MKSNEQKILYLFDEIGKIDDKYVAEAMEYRRYAPEKRSFIKILSLAACIALIAVFCLIGISNIADALLDTDKNDFPSDGGTVYETPDALCEVMTELDVKFLSSAQISSPTAELVCDGNVRIIWTYNGEVYYSVTVDPNDAKALERHLAGKSSSRVSPDDEYGDFRFYVSHGNGLLETPYIEDNAGRLSVGSLSDYLPEVYPSRELADFISSLIKRAEN